MHDDGDWHHSLAGYHGLIRTLHFKLKQRAANRINGLGVTFPISCIYYSPPSLGYFLPHPPGLPFMTILQEVLIDNTLYVRIRRRSFFEPTNPQRMSSNFMSWLILPVNLVPSSPKYQL